MLKLLDFQLFQGADLRFAKRLSFHLTLLLTFILSSLLTPFGDGAHIPLSPTPNGDGAATRSQLTQFGQFGDGAHFKVSLGNAAHAAGDGATPGIPSRVFVKDQEFRVEELLTGQGILWGMAFLPSGEILLTEKSGKLILWGRSKKSIEFIAGVPDVADHGQGGLLDIHLDPDFQKNLLLYLTYAVKVGEGYTTRLAKATYSGGKLTDLKVLFTGEPSYSAGHHFGSRIAIKDGYIFFTIGDRGQRDDAQKLSTHNGKVLRLKLDGSVPKDNPFVGVQGARPEIWSYGHRNPQGLSFHPESGDLWLNEHGPRGGDEINLIKKGLNYGWPLATFGTEYHGPKIGQTPPLTRTESPVMHFTPSIAPCGLAIVPQGKLGALAGAFVSGALALTHLNLVWLKGSKVESEVRLFEGAGERIRNVKYYEGTEPGIYFTTDSGKVFRISELKSK